MENHPIPQDVTGFQFKLIGDMTVKQFAYIAAGVVLAVIFYYAPFHILIKIFCIPLFALIGVALAFFPISGRPLDVMVVYFIKAILSPNQYIYQKSGSYAFAFLTAFTPAKAAPTPIPKQTQSNALKQYLQNLPQAQKDPLDQKESQFFQGLFPTSSSQTTLPKTVQPAPSINAKQPAVKVQPPSQPPPIKLITKTPLLQEASLPQPKPQSQPQPIPPPIAKPAQPQQPPQQVIPQVPKTLNQTPTQSPALPDLQVLTLQKQLEQLHLQKKQLEQQVAILAQNLNTQKSKEPALALSQNQTPNVREIPKELSARIGLPIAIDAPNLITGIIKDPRGNTLPNILVEVKDKDGNPIRAFKTNSLGQFASATALLNGAYRVEFEDPSGTHKFDAIELITKGNIILPLEVISTDAREELRRQLFTI